MEPRDAGAPAIERALAALVGVEAACVRFEGEQIAEVHIAACPGSRAKNIARDVRSYLAAALGIEVDYKRISIAMRRPEPGEEPAAGADAHGAGSDEPAACGEPPGAGAQERAAGPGERAACPGERAACPGEHAARAGEHAACAGGLAARILFRSVELEVAGQRATVRVALDAGGRRLCGRAEGIPAGLGTERLVLQATLAALEPLLAPGAQLAPGELAVARLGDGDVVAVEALILRARDCERRVGACRLEGDRLRAVVFAALAALNRRLGALGARPWTEVRVEPESAKPPAVAPEERGGSG